MLFGTIADIGNFIGLPDPFCTFTVIVMFFVPVPFEAACDAACEVVWLLFNFR